MTPDRWEKICVLLSGVLDLEPPDRADYLRSESTFEGNIAAETERVLHDLEQADREGFLREPAWVIDDVPSYLPDIRNGDSEYTDIEYIGHGGMGVVYKAYHRNIDSWVALKVSKPLDRSEEKDRERFRNEAQNMARLKHPNIVSVHSTGEYEGRPYFVMDLIDIPGEKTLPNRLTEFTDHPRKAAEFVEKVALAVHHAHQRLVLHNDLKPANILVDEEGQPYVTDFGLAIRVSDDTGVATEGIQGTAGYMSPEQAEGKGITVLSDIYGLGGILYTLLTGQPPFRGGTVRKTLEMVRHAPPRPIRTQNPLVDQDLEVICLKCLDKAPANRYASANALAQDLIRYRKKEQTTARAWSFRERTAGWLRSHKTEAGLALAAIAVWCFSLVMAVSVVGALQEQRLTEAKSTVDFAATDLARAASIQLGGLRATVNTKAKSPDLATLLSRNNRTDMERFLWAMIAEQPLFTTCYALNDRGIMLAHAQLDKSDKVIVGKDYSGRDYFVGPKGKAIEGVDGTSVSRVFLSDADGKWKFAISSPIRDRSRLFAGVLSCSLATKESLETLIQHEGRKAALVASREKEPGKPAEDRHLILFHPAYPKPEDALKFEPVEFPGADKLMSSPISSEANYQDPVAAIYPEYTGRWIAGFARVPDTDFVFVVQQRYNEAVSLDPSVIRQLVRGSALTSLVVAVIVFIMLRAWTRSRATI